MKIGTKIVCKNSVTGKWANYNNTKNGPQIASTKFDSYQELKLYLNAIEGLTE